MPVQSIECTDVHIKICTAVGKCVEIPYFALSGTRLEQAEQLVALLQDLLDYRQRITTLPHDDPDRDIDPARPELFWDGSDLVGRSIEVHRAVWDDQQKKFLIGVRRTE